MAFDKRMYSKGERPHPIIRGRVDKRYQFLRIGDVLEIDPDRFRVNIQWIDSDGSPQWIDVPFAYVGPAGCLGMFPEKHSRVVCAYYSTGLDHAQPLIIGYLPTNILAGTDHSDVKDQPDSLPNEDENIIKYRYWDLAEGDMIIKSPLGARALFNRNVVIKDLLGNSLSFKYGDRSIVSSSVANLMYADGAIVRAGPAIRNGMNLYDIGGNKILGTNGSDTTLPDGNQAIYIVPFGQDIQYDTKYYSEYRIDVDDICDAILDEPDSPTSVRDPIVALSLGNYIDADRRTPRYGTILRPTLFSAPQDRVGAFSLVQAVQNKGTDEVATLGMAYALHFLKSGTFIGVDKEGHHYMYLSASQVNPLGAGKSMSVLAQGSLKEIWGSSADTNNSWDLTAKGGIRWQVGSHNAINRSRSIDIRTASSIYIEVNSNDEDGYAKQERIFGDVFQHTKGDHSREVVGTDNLTVTGLKSELVFGAAMYVYEADKAENVAGQSTEIVSSEKQCKFGTRSTTISSGDDTLAIIKGNREETITLGAHKTSIVATSDPTGNALIETITTGGRKTSITTGNYQVGVTAGTIQIKTTAGTVTISGTQVEVSGTVKIVVNAPIVEIGSSPTKSGVVTGAGPMPSHFDYTTGAPIKGLVTVKAGA